MTAPQLYSVEKAAEILDVSTSTVERLIHCGALAAVNVSAAKRPKIRITDKAIAEFVANRSIGNVRGGAA